MSATLRNLKVRPVEIIMLAALLAGALWFFTWNNAFPFTLHADEGKKVSYIMGNAPDFHHPLLLIQTGRLIQAVTDWSGPEGAALAGRWGSALAGVLLLAGFYFWVRRTQGGLTAWIATAGVGMTPLVAVHAHYVKEDMMLTAAIMGVALALRRWRESDGRWILIALGVALGLAAASHYKSVLLLGLMVWVARERHEPMKLLSIFATAAVVFLAVNYTMVTHAVTFLSGAGTMFTNAVGGQEVDTYPVPEFFTFHLFHSLIPGMGWGIVIWAMVGGGQIWRRGTQATFEDRFALIATVMFYLIVEFLPKKPPPDFGRYMLPCAPFVIWLAWRGAQQTWGKMNSVWWRNIVSLGILVAVAQPVWKSMRIVANMENDTRIQAPSWLRDFQETANVRGEAFQVMSENYATVTPEGVTSVADKDLIAARENGLTHVLVSSFRYQRYLEGAEMAQQRPAIHNLGGFYRELFEQPYEELLPNAPSYAFFNPTLRLVDIRQMKLPEKPLLRRP